MKYIISSFVLLSLIVGGLSVGHARLSKLWTYSELTKESTLVIIATHERSSDNKTKTELAGHPVVGVTSTFTVLSVLKGDFDEKTIDVNHCRYDDDVSGIENGFRFITFSDEDKTTYLIFLKGNAKDGFEPVSGQRDPVDSFREISDTN